MTADHSEHHVDNGAATGRFFRHFIEMVAAMAVGMVAYGALFRSPMDPTGFGAVLRSHRYLDEILMLGAMETSMAAFMLYRGHGARLTAEMAVGMALPTLAVIALTAGGTLPFFTDATLNVSSHVAMLLGMLAAMAVRWTVYAGSHRHGGPPRAP
ncbi:MAG: hypothetical protein U1E56_03095 [Bauldia sp.]